MDQTHDPKPPELPKRNWFERNLKWLIPATIVGVIAIIVALVGAFMMLIFGMIRSSEPYTMAFERATASPAAIEMLGQPIDDGFFVTGNISTSSNFDGSGSSGRANLSIPLKGPHGKAILHVVATQSDGEWQFSRLMIHDKETNLRINLLTE